ncbi:MAG: sulfotransferase [Xanthomonadales bacterium]|nr:sulfotransferase [Xanthomonadales bacterium]
MLEDILKLHQAGQLEEAETRYREWLAFNPDDPEALHLLAILRRQREDLGEALELAGKAVELVPERAHYQLTLAGLQLHARQFERAREGFATALRLNPDLPGAALGLAQIDLMRADVDSAAEALARAERLVPGHPQLLALQGGLAQARGDHASAARLLLESAQRNPNDAIVQMQLGLSLAATGKAGFAEQALGNALRLKPGYTAAEIALAQLLMRERRPDEALARFESVLAREPGHALALAGRADLRRAAGDNEAALADYRQAHEAAPNAPGVAEALVSGLMVAGAEAEAGEILAAALAARPTAAGLRRLDLALAARRPGDALLDACRAWHTADPRSLEAAERLAGQLEVRRDFAAADALARGVLAQDSRAGFARLLLARSALREGRPDEAQEQLNRTPEAGLPAQRRPERASLRGLARDALGDREGAVEAWLSGHRQQAHLAPLVQAPEVSGLRLPPITSASATGPAPVFLLGLPGAGTESLVALLRAGGASVLGDRFGHRVRPDPMASAAFVEQFAALADDPAVAERFRDAYLAGLAAADLVLAPDLVDWLPFVDLRQVALIQAAFPSARFIAVQRDPRDCLLTWLALGCPQALTLPDATQAATWLAGANQHLEAARAHVPGDRWLAVDAAELADPAALAGRVWPFLGLAAPGPTDLPTSITQGLGDLPTLLPDGHWRRYDAALADAFARLS